jgi:hypothetical protein
MDCGRRLVFLILTALLCASVAQATDLACPAANTPISSATLGGAHGCNIGGLFNFTGFDTTGSAYSSAQLGAGQMPLLSNSTSTNGLQFLAPTTSYTATPSTSLGLRFKTIGDPDWNLDTSNDTDGLFFDSRIIYTVTRTGGAQPTGAYLGVQGLNVSFDSFAGSTIASGSTGVADFAVGVTILKEICPNVLGNESAFTDGCAGKVVLRLNITSNTGKGGYTNSTFSDFSTGSTFYVRDRLFVNYGSDNKDRKWDLDDASDQWIENRFYTPEPGTYILISSALVGMGLLCRRRKPKV